MTNTTCNAGSTIRHPSAQASQPQPQPQTQPQPHQAGGPAQQAPTPDAHNPNPNTNRTALQDRVHQALTYLYQDLTRLHAIAALSIVLHPADRALSNPPRAPLVGIGPAQLHEEALVAATGGTLVMEVERITVGEGWEGGGKGEGEGGVFACVMGVLRAGEGGDGGRAESGQQQQQQQGEGVGVVGGGRGKIAVPFCGLWRFDGEGKAVEHWENAADPGALARWLRGE